MVVFPECAHMVAHAVSVLLTLLQARFVEVDGRDESMPQC
jgi:hypothetical protein